MTKIEWVILLTKMSHLQTKALFDFAESRMCRVIWLVFTIPPTLNYVIFEVKNDRKTRKNPWHHKNPQKMSAQQKQLRIQTGVVSRTFKEKVIWLKEEFYGVLILWE